MGRLAVCIDWPNAHVPWACFSSIWNSDIRREPDVNLLRPVAPDTNLAYNINIKAGLDHGAEEFLFIAADQEVPHDIMARMRAHNKDIVGAMTISRQKGNPLLAARFTKQNSMVWVVPETPLERVDFVGPGCLYVKAEVFKKVPPPWFMNIISPDCLSLIVTNDFYFSRKCEQYGIETYIDATLDSPHHDARVLSAKSLCQTSPLLVEVHG